MIKIRPAWQGPAWETQNGAMHFLSKSFCVGNIECVYKISVLLCKIADFHGVFVQVIKLHHFCVAANQAIIKLLTRRIFVASIDSNTNRNKKRLARKKLLQYSRWQSATCFRPIFAFIVILLQSCGSGFQNGVILTSCGYFYIVEHAHERKSSPD